MRAASRSPPIELSAIFSRHADNQSAAGAEGVRVLLRIADIEEEDSGVRGKTLYALLDIVSRHAYNQSAAGAEGVRVLLCIADS